MNEKLVLIPGFANDELAWHHQIEALTELYDVHVFVMNEESSRKQMVDSLLAEAPEKFVLAGHSMGGWIAQAVAAAAPDRVQKLILLNTWATPDANMIVLKRQICEGLKQGLFEEVMQKHLPSLVHPSRLQDIALLGALQKMVMSFPLPILVQQLEAMLADYSSLHHHSAIVAPTLVVHSREDALFPEEYKAILDGIKNAELAILEECGHASTVEKPEAVTDLIRDFIAKN